ncbi:hypothetical protein GE09DRAFT_46398 [Coniochaeta sp. 2T2.1]|nr:hypothetical protein GE09DRAFT_46398 [Coniochaeta sp. 2T2.1]
MICGGDGVFTVYITLWYEKGMANDPTNVMTIAVRELEGETNNHLCAVKFLLIHALRIGAVYETSWSVIRQVKRGTVVAWKTPQRHVLCAMAGISKEMLLDTPSPANSATGVLREAAMLAGLNKKVVAHDIRRGCRTRRCSSRTARIC